MAQRRKKATPTRLEQADVATPIGTFRVVYEGSRLRGVDLIERGVEQSDVPEGVVRRRAPYPSGSPPHQLAEYFRGERRAFDLVVEPFGGTPFDRKVWATLRSVPNGRTITYGELAKRSGHPGAARAVGGSMRRNPIPIVVPCHRVVGSEGSLTGYGLGLWRKRWLLDREGAWPLRSKSAEGPRDAAHQRTLDAGADPGPSRPAPSQPA